MVEVESRDGFAQLGAARCRDCERRGRDDLEDGSFEILDARFAERADS